MNLSAGYYDIKYGIRNIFRWLPVIWFDDDIDWSYLALLMEKKLRFMSASTSWWIVSGADRAGKQMKLCAALLKRMQSDNYFDNACGLHSVDATAKEIVKRAGPHASYMFEQDCRMLGSILGRHMTEWWD
jgi:hypothetical protein